MTPEQEGARRLTFTDDELRYIVNAIGNEPFGSSVLDPDALADRIEDELRTPAPSPHEGEAARGDEHPDLWECPVHGIFEPRKITSHWPEGTGGELCPIYGFERGDCCAETVKPWSDPCHSAPTEPRSISEEQLERDAKIVRERVLPEIEGSDEGWALNRVLAAYEQAEARADEEKALNERLKAATEAEWEIIQEAITDAPSQLGESVVAFVRHRLNTFGSHYAIEGYIDAYERASRAEAERDTAQERAEQAEARARAWERWAQSAAAMRDQALAERDTAQASEARLREVLVQIERQADEWTPSWVLVLVGNALTSTPNPEEGER